MSTENLAKNLLHLPNYDYLPIEVRIVVDKVINATNANDLMKVPLDDILKAHKEVVNRQPVVINQISELVEKIKRIPAIVASSDYI